MIRSRYPVYEQATLETDILALLRTLGHGKVPSVAYDTAFVGRLSKYYPEKGFDSALEWLRRNQYDDGTWGAPLQQYHDRFASTLAAIVALREAGKGSRDERRVKRGEAALWKIVSRLGRDDSDTVGFPIVAASLAEDAIAVGLDTPRPPIRYAAAYKKKVQKMLEQPHRDWRGSSMSFSLEGLRRALRDDDEVISEGGLVAGSPSATAAYLFQYPREDSLRALQGVIQDDGGVTVVNTFDVFEIMWSLYELHIANAIQPDMPEVRRYLDYLWSCWNPETGLYFSRYFPVTDLDNTSAAFILLRWGGYPVSADVFEYFELEDHFCTYKQEANPSPSAHLRLLLALQTSPEHPKQRVWRQKALTALRTFDENGSYWWDKWHTSPYYVGNLAIRALHRLDPELAASRLKWILKTQNDDGGWSYLDDRSTAEETAFCLDALLLWDRMVDVVDSEIITRAAEFLSTHSQEQDYTPLWISKVLYAPHAIVKAAIYSAQFQYLEW
jgi:hypothetical protein